MSEIFIRLKPKAARRLLEDTGDYSAGRRRGESLKIFDQFFGSNGSSCPKGVSARVYGRFRRPSPIRKAFSRLLRLSGTGYAGRDSLAGPKALLGLYLIAVRDKEGRLIVTDFRRL